MSIEEKEHIEISNSCKEYWYAVSEVIDAAGSYAAAIKLRANLLDPNTAWKVKHVLEDSFCNSMANLNKAIAYREDTFYGKVEKLNILCRLNCINTIQKPRVLLDLLISEKRRRSYRDKLSRRLEKGIICPMQDFETRGRN